MTSETVQRGARGESTGDQARTFDLDAGRRAFIRNLGLGAAGAAALGTASIVPAEAQAIKQPEGDGTGITDADILNFALNLEYVEAEFYLRAAFGRGLTDGDITGDGFGGRDQLGPVRGGRQVRFETNTIRLYAEEIARDEEAHVRFLRGALGSARVARPTLDIGGAFTALAREAGLIGSNQDFDAYANENNFLLAAFIFEDVGVTAYKGAAPLIQDRGILEAAAGLLAVEAYHAANIRSVLFSRGLFGQTNDISDLRDRLDGSDDRDQDIGGNDRANIAPTDNNGLAFSRTPRQVLNIVYFGVDRGAGGFFPDSFNGNIR